MARADNVKDLKVELLNLVSAAMIKEPKFDGAEFDDPSTTSGRIVQLVRTISEDDGEFALKLALYVRLDLGLRGTANLLAALAAYSPRSQPFLAAYMPKLVVLPSDWLQIATFARDMPLREGTGLPNSLRKALAGTFGKFNEHSLAKYNKEKAQAKKKKRAGARGDAEAASAAQPLTLKMMIRMLHIAKPNYYVMALLGKRYPATEAEFREAGLEAEGRKFDPALSGQRMRLAVPLTWETQLASRGNTAQVWDELVAAKSLPFMAMLRNLRNIILAGCSKETHETIIGRLTNEDQVAGSKQFPYRFFSAYDVLDIDPEHAYDPPAEGKSNRPSTKPKKVPATAPTPAQIAELLQRYRTALDRAVQLATKCNIRPIHGRTVVAVAVHDAMFAPMTAQGAKGIGSVRSLHEVALLLGVMFKYACERCDLVLFSNNACRVVDDLRDGAILKNMDAIKATAEELRHAVDVRPADSEFSGVGGATRRFPFGLLDGIVNNREDINALVVISDGLATYDDANDFAALGGLPSYLRKMRLHCNPDLLFVDVDVSSKGSGAGAAELSDFSHANDVCITGFSDSILRFVAERGGGGPIRYVESIDKVYDIDTSGVSLGFDTSAFVPEPVALSDGSGSDSDDDSAKSTRRLFHSSDAAGGALSTSSPDGSPASVSPRSGHGVLTNVRTLRFFISSTFVDMQNERNALVLDVFPAVRRMAQACGIRAHIVEIDFRWGITADEAATNSLSICLNEAARCAPFFIGIYGARRGYTPALPYKVAADEDVPSDHFAWLHSLTAPASITELETRQAWVSTGKRGDDPRMILLFRDNAATVSSLPKAHHATFAAESDAAGTAAKEFRKFARERLSGASIRSYSALYDDKATAAATAARQLSSGSTSLKPPSSVVLSMEDFKRKALKQIWSAVVAACPPDSADNGATQSGADSDDEEAASPATKDGGGGNTSPASEAPGADPLQEAFASRIVSTYVRQKGFFSQVIGFVLGVGVAVPEGASHQVLVINATEGCGKSAAMAAIAHELRTTQPGTCVVSHFFGVGAGDVASCVANIALSLIQRLHLDDEFAVTPSLDANLAMLPQLLEVASHHSRIVILLDGLDSCSAPDALLKALPVLVPAAPPMNCRFILSLRHTSTFNGAMRARKPAATVMAIPDLTRAERADFVRNHLREFGKRLQESAARGNQLLPLIRKQDSGKPAHLMQALTHLRLFSTFDTLNSDINSLPATIAALNADIVKRFEAAFGAGVCGAVLSALVLSAPLGGVSEADLYRLAPDVALTRRLLSLVDAALIYTEDGCVLLASDALTSTIRRKYLSRSADVVAMHAQLCRSYVKRERLPGGVTGSASAGGGSAGAVGSSFLSPSSSLFGGGGGAISAGGNQTASQPTITETDLLSLSPRALLCGMFHALHGRNFELLETLLGSVACLERVVSAHLLPLLLNIVNDLAAVNKILFKKIEPFADFLIAHRHVLLRRPHLVVQCALNMPSGSVVAAAMQRLRDGTSGGANANAAAEVDWLEWRNRDVHGEKECTQTTAITTQAVLCVAFDARGELLALGGADWTCRVVKVFDGTIPFKLRHPNSVTAAIFGAQSRQLITGCEDGDIRMWSMFDGAVVQKLASHSRRINELALHPTRPLLLSASDDCTARLWNLGLAQPNLRPMTTLRKHSRPVSCCAYHQQGALYATGSWDGKVIIWQQEGGKETFFNVRRGAVRSVAFVPSMVVTLAVATYDGKIDLYDYAAGGVSATFNRHLARPVCSIAFSADAKRMLTTDIDGRALVWRYSVVGEVIGVLVGHAEAVNTARFHPKDNRRLVTASSDATVRHWLTGDDDERIGSLHGAEVASAAFAHGKKLALTASRDGRVHAHDLAESNRRIKFTIDGGAPVTALAVVDDESAIVTGGVDGAVKVWLAEPGLNGRDGLLLWAPEQRHPQPVAGIACIGTRTATVSADGLIIVFDTAKPKEGARSLRLGVPSEAAGVVWRNANEAVVATSDGSVCVVACPSDTNDPLTLSRYNEGAFADVSFVQSVAISPNREYIAVACGSGDIAVHETRGRIDAEVCRRRVRDELKRDGRAAIVHSVAFASDSTLVVGSSDMSLRLYAISPAGELVLKQIFFATAAVTAVGADPLEPGALYAGDALGNVYALQAHWAHHPRQGGASAGAGIAKSDSFAPESADGLQSMSYWRSASSNFGFDAMFDGDGESGDDSDGDSAAGGRAKSSASSTGSEAERAAEANARFIELMSMFVPPPELKGEAKRAWYMRRQAMLKEAMRAMKHSPAARMAVRFHAERTMKSYAAYSSYLAQQ